MFVNFLKNILPNIMTLASETFMFTITGVINVLSFLSTIVKKAVYYYWIILKFSFLYCCAIISVNIVYGFGMLMYGFCLKLMYTDGSWELWVNFLNGRVPIWQFIHHFFITPYTPTPTKVTPLSLRLEMLNGVPLWQIWEWESQNEGPYPMHRIENNLTQIPRDLTPPISQAQYSESSTVWLWTAGFLILGIVLGISFPKSE